MASVRVPQIQDIETAIRLYYERIELSNSDIAALFGCSRATAIKLKRLGKEQMDADEIPNWNALHVNTRSAFKAWGMDIADLEQRLKRLRQLKLRDVQEQQAI